MRQLWGAIAAVFESWNTRRAIDYRKLHDIPDSMGTAVNVVAMVFGNLGEDSGTGVTFSRDPSTGEKVLYGRKTLGVIRSTVWIGPDGKVRRHWKRVAKAEAHPEQVLEALRAGAEKR